MGCNGATSPQMDSNDLQQIMSSNHKLKWTLHSKTSIRGTLFFKIFIPTPESLNIFRIRKILEYEALKMSFWPSTWCLKFGFQPIFIIYQDFEGPLNPSPCLFVSKFWEYFYQKNFTRTSSRNEKSSKPSEDAILGYSKFPHISTFKFPQKQKPIICDKKYLFFSFSRCTWIIEVTMPYHFYFLL